MRHFATSNYGLSTRYLGFIALGMLIIANLMMKPRIKTKRRPSKEENMMLLRKLATDVPYIIAIIGYLFPTDITKVVID